MLTSYVAVHALIIFIPVFFLLCFSPGCDSLHFLLFLLFVFAFPHFPILFHNVLSDVYHIRHTLVRTTGRTTLGTLHKLLAFHVRLS